MVLGKIAEAHFVSPVGVPAIGGQAAHQDLEQGRFAQAVRANDADALAPAQDQGHVRKHALVAVGLAQVLDVEDVLAARARLFETQRGRAARATHQFFHLDAFDLLKPALRLRGLGVLGAEALDPSALARNFVLGARDGGLLALADGGFVDDKGRVAAGVERDGAVVDVEGVGGDVVEKALIVRDDDRATSIVGQEFLQPTNSQDVEVVGWLVEQQDVRAADQNLRQEHAQLEATRQRRQRRAMRDHGNPEADQHFAGAGLQGVAVVRGDQIFKIADTARIGMSLVADAALLGQSLPHHGVAAHGKVQYHRIVVESQERRLARAIGTDQAVAQASAKLQRHVLEENARAVFLGEIAGVDHAGRVRVAPLRPV